MARKRLIPVRYTDKEAQQVKLAAQTRGMTVSQYVRFRTLGPELDQEKRIATLEAKLGIRNRG